MSRPHAILQAMSAWQSARARLLQDDPDLAGDEAALTALLGPETGDVRDILARLLRAALHAKDMAELAHEQAARIAARQKRYASRAEQLRGTAFAIMDVICERRIELPDMTATIRAGGASCTITDAAALPDEYVRIKREPDKAAILADLKVGLVIAGAELTNAAPSIQIRSK